MQTGSQSKILCCIFYKNFQKSRSYIKKSNMAQTWPDPFGFSIYGNGPCYVINVAEFGAAKSSGLKNGDEILQVKFLYILLNFIISTKKV